MGMILALAIALGIWRGGRAAFESLRSLPRRNEDMVFW